MIRNKKVLKQIEESKRQLEESKKQLEKIKYQLQIEKQELYFIKEQLEDMTPKVDVSNVYIWKDKNICSIVRLNTQKIRGRCFAGGGSEVEGYSSTLVDIFTNNIVFKKNSRQRINENEIMVENKYSSSQEYYYAQLIPLYEIDNNILAFADKKVPLYVLQQLYYKLNNVDVNDYVLKKIK